MNVFKVKSVPVGGNHPFFLIAGPCVIESEEATMRLAESLKKLAQRINIPWIFKASYDKANRSSIDSYRGPGIERGLQILERVQKKLDVIVLSDVHTPEEVKSAGQVLDVIQIPAFLCRQTDLLVEAGKTNKPVNIKKGQFMAAEDMDNSMQKVAQDGNHKVMITERGTTMGYHNLVVDMRSLGIIRDHGYPVVYDMTHSVQLPGARGNESDGDRQFIPLLARAAVAAGVDGLFMEVHENPTQALCDSACQWPLNKVEQLLIQLKEIDCLIKKQSAPVSN